MTNYEKIMSEMSHNRMAKLLEKDDFCCGTHVEKDGFECKQPDDFSCLDCLKNWLMEESE